MPSNEHYLHRIAPQHRQPNFMEWLTANLSPHLDAENILKSLDEVFDLDNARGVQLDILGQLVGRSRLLSFNPSDGSSPLLDDYTYEMLIRAKISTNQWNGTIPDVLELWSTLFPDYQLFIQDNQDMTMELYVVGLVTPLEMELMARGYIAPKPMGVRINYNFPVLREYETTSYFISAGGVVTETAATPVVRPRNIESTTYTISAGLVYSEVHTKPITLQRNFTNEIYANSVALEYSELLIPPAKGG